MSVHQMGVVKYGQMDCIIIVRVFIKYLITLGYLLRTKRLRAYNL